MEKLQEFQEAASDVSKTSALLHKVDFGSWSPKLIPNEYLVFSFLCSSTGLAWDLEELVKNWF